MGLIERVKNFGVTDLTGEDAHRDKTEGCKLGDFRSIGWNILGGSLGIGILTASLMGFDPYDSGIKEQVDITGDGIEEIVSYERNREGDLGLITLQSSHGPIYSSAIGGIMPTTSIEDVNQDGLEDVRVMSVGHPDYAYVNQGDDSFVRRYEE